MKDLLSRINQAEKIWRSKQGVFTSIKTYDRSLKRDWLNAAANHGWSTWVAESIGPIFWCVKCKKKLPHKLAVESTQEPCQSCVAESQTTAEGPPKPKRVPFTQKQRETSAFSCMLSRVGYAAVVRSTNDG